MFRTVRADAVALSPAAFGPLTLTALEPTVLASLADTPTVLARVGGNEVSTWGPILILLLIAVVFAVGTVALSSLVGRSVTGRVKSGPYESGIDPVTDARRRFNVRYYIVAMIFLLFDVETVLLFPWAILFGGDPTRGGGLLLLWEMFVFVAILLVGYVYAWRRGVLQFD